MKDLIDNIIAFFEAAITAGSLSANKVFKGLQDAPAQAADSEFPYIMVDDGGEATDIENPDSTRAQNRIYNVVLEFGTYDMNLETALDQILDLTQEAKAVLESESNRQKDGFTWGVEITTFGMEEDEYYFRGRQVIVSYTELEDTIDKY